MAAIKKFIEKPVKGIGLILKKRLGLLSPPVILAYRGYGTNSELHVKGHVLDDRVLYEAQHGDRRRKNLRAMLSRYVSSVIPDVRVEITFGTHRQIVTTDDSGFFAHVFKFNKPLAHSGWHQAQYRVLDKLVEDQEDIVTQEPCYIMPSDIDQGIISDVDDTIIISHATTVFKKLRLILTKNAKTRLPFQGVAPFYQGLVKSKSGVDKPIFYVSSSEWNLYDFLVDFCETQNIPTGPFLLQDLKKNLFSLMKSGGGTHNHKYYKISHLLRVFNSLRFILIGDSGQRDAELYSQIVKEFPGRIAAIYIRKVRGKRKYKRIIHLADELKTHEVDMLLVKNTAQAATHALQQGFINETYYKKIVQAC